MKRFGLLAMAILAAATPLACAQGKTGKMVYDVKQYGAKGDGTTDDSGAIQTAINSAEQDYGTVELPPGTYLCSNPLTIDAAITFEGSRGGSTLDFSQLASGNAITVGVSKAITGAVLNGFVMKGNANIYGLWLNQPGNASGVVADSDFRDIRIEGFKWGIRDQYSWDNLFENVRCQNCTMGANLGGECNATEFTRCSFVSGNVGVQAMNCEGINFTTCEFANLKTLGITIFQSVVNMTMPYIEASPHFANVGSKTERAPSSLSISSGILNGDIVVHNSADVVTQSGSTKLIPEIRK